MTPSMPELNLSVTRNFLATSGRFDLAGANSLRSALSEYVPVGEPRIIGHRSADHSFEPSIIQLLGTADVWVKFLLVSATAFWAGYLTALGKHGADMTRDKIKSLLKNKEVKPLASCADALLKEAQNREGQVEIVLGLSISDDALEATISVKSLNSEEIAKAMAAVIVKAQEISNAIQAEITASGTPVGRIRIFIEDNDGSLLIKLQNGPKLEEREIRIP